MNKLDKIKEVQQFIEQNKDKDLTWCADNNGIVSRRTFFNWRKEGLLSASASASASATPTSEIIENIFDEHEKNEDRKSKNRQYNYNTRSRKALVDELQKENEELKSKYEELKSKYEELKSKYEELKTDFIFERQLKEKYINQIHDFPFKQSEFDELKKKYDNLQIEYITLKTGDKPQNKPDKSDKSEIKNQTQWWEEL